MPSLEELRLKVDTLQRQVRSGAKEWGTPYQRMRWVVQTLIDMTISLFFGLIKVAIDLFLWSWEIGTLLLVGLGLVELRLLIIILCPVMLQQYKFATFIINAILIFLEIGVNVLITAVDEAFIIVNSIITILNDISQISGHKKVTNFRFHLIYWIPIQTLSYAQVKQALTSIPPTCKRYDTSNKVLQFFISEGLTQYTCPLVRFTWPDPTVYKIAYAVLGFTIRGNPEPDVYDPNKNCNPVSTTVYDYICAGMGTSFVFLDTFLAIFIIYLTLKDLYTSVKSLVDLTKHAFIEGFIDVYECVSMTLRVIFF